MQRVKDTRTRQCAIYVVNRYTDLFLRGTCWSLAKDGSVLAKMVRNSVGMNDQGHLSVIITVGSHHHDRTTKQKQLKTVHVYHIAADKQLRVLS